MTAAAILETILRDRSLFEERNFVSRFEAIEMLEETLAFAMGSGPEVRAFGGAGGLGSMPPKEATERLALARAAELKSALEDVDDRLFARLRAEIAAGGLRGNAFRELLPAYCGSVATEGEEYDTLDIFVNRLCSYLPMPWPIQPLGPEMVDFHKTPARVVLELSRWVAPGDVFVDLGAGLGQVVLLVHLLTGAAGRGVEIEPAFCRYAWDCAAGLGLSRAFDLPGVAAPVSFIEGDARFACYDEGTVFFMYTPFTGELLATVFGLLQREALSRPFTLVTYGPCTKHAARQGWLRVVDPADALCVFRAG